MKGFLARLFNLFTILNTLIFLVGIISQFIDKTKPDSLLTISILYFGFILGLNYLIFGKLRLWNGKQE